MKKKAILIVLAIIILLLIVLIRYNSGARTVEEAINSPVSKPGSIIYEEKTDKGSIVFCDTSSGDGLYTAIMSKTFGRYKTVYSGVQGDVKTVSKEFGLAHMYMPAIDKTALPIYFGVIGNPEINQVKIIEKKRNIEGQAKIIDANGTRIWLVYMNQFQGSNFDIVGISADGKELTRITENISPYYAEQKPFKSPYK